MSQMSNIKEEEKKSKTRNVKHPITFLYSISKLQICQFLDLTINEMLPLNAPLSVQFIWWYVRNTKRKRGSV